jgi:succinyl-CoA synthetase alpha subunit
MTVSGATAGFQPLTVTNNSTTYTVSALLIQPKKVTAQLNANMPAGVTLTVILVPPSGATNNGRVALDNIARDVVTNITNAIPQSRTVEYQLTATVSAGVVPTSTRTVTLTLVNSP